MTYWERYFGTFRIQNVICSLLDFGIETCFIIGLNGFWKMWLQYLFPFYVWSIVGVIILCARYSTTLTYLLGNRAVSLLATLFLLSYTKILRTIISSAEFTTLGVYNCTDETDLLTVWTLDGNYTYCHFPHILLFIAGLFTFTVLWLPYTLLLLLMQWVRKISHFKLLKWIPRLNPLYDSYFAPLKDKHHYWFGVLLIIRCALLITFTATNTVDPSINHLVVLITAAVLLCYANYHRVYTNKAVQLNENLFLLLLVLIGGSGILSETEKFAVTYAPMHLLFFVY